jgi:hypothetical protein
VRAISPTRYARLLWVWWYARFLPWLRRTPPLFGRSRLGVPTPRITHDCILCSYVSVRASINYLGIKMESIMAILTMLTAHASLDHVRHINARPISCAPRTAIFFLLLWLTFRLATFASQPCLDCPRLFPVLHARGCLLAIRSCLRRRFAQFKLVDHFLEVGSESYNLFL